MKTTHLLMTISRWTTGQVLATAMAGVMLSTSITPAAAQMICDGDICVDTSVIVVQPIPEPPENTDWAACPPPASIENQTVLFPNLFWQAEGKGAGDKAWHQYQALARVTRKVIRRYIETPPVSLTSDAGAVTRHKKRSLSHLTRRRRVPLVLRHSPMQQPGRRFFVLMMKRSPWPGLVKFCNTNASWQHISRWRCSKSGSWLHAVSLRRRASRRIRGRISAIRATTCWGPGADYSGVTLPLLLWSSTVHTWHMGSCKLP